MLFVRASSGYSIQNVGRNMIIMEIHITKVKSYLLTISRRLSYIFPPYLLDCDVEVD